MTAQEIIEKEPRLQEVIEWLKEENEWAGNQDVMPMFYDIWPEVKRRLTPLVGWDAQNRELQESREWDIMVNHLERLAYNFR